jgi:hypothetical protein
VVEYGQLFELRRENSVVQHLLNGSPRHWHSVPGDRRRRPPDGHRASRPVVASFIEAEAELPKNHCRCSRRARRCCRTRPGRRTRAAPHGSGGVAPGGAGGGRHVMVLALFEGEWRVRAHHGGEAAVISVRTVLAPGLSAPALQHAPTPPTTTEGSARSPATPPTHLNRSAAPATRRKPNPHDRVEAGLRSGALGAAGHPVVRAEAAVAALSPDRPGVAMAPSPWSAKRNRPGLARLKQTCMPLRHRVRLRGTAPSFRRRRTCASHAPRGGAGPRPTEMAGPRGPL